jgi:hypothetical protein
VEIERVQTGGESVAAALLRVRIQRTELAHPAQKVVQGTAVRRWKALGDGGPAKPHSRLPGDRAQDGAVAAAAQGIEELRVQELGTHHIGRRENALGNSSAVDLGAGRQAPYGIADLVGEHRNAPRIAGEKLQHLVRDGCVRR